MPDTDAELTTLFLECSRHQFLEQSWPRLRQCVESLTDEQIWHRPNEASNSIGNLLLHLNGNVRQWLVTSFNRVEDHRNRPTEFSETRVIPKAELLTTLAATLEEARTVLARLTTADLLASYEIQGYNPTGLEVVYHVVEHFALHYGQIIYITKMLTAKDLGFYSYAITNLYFTSCFNNRS
jgi:uncharacterized damage-inducible protein DinB